jgi:hypothetical protein
MGVALCSAVCAAKTASSIAVNDDADAHNTYCASATPLSALVVPLIMVFASRICPYSVVVSNTPSALEVLNVPIAVFSSPSAMPIAACVGAEVSAVFASAMALSKASITDPVTHKAAGSMSRPAKLLTVALSFAAPAVPMAAASADVSKVSAPKV